MANIKKEIEGLRAKIARLEKEQKKAEVEKKALGSANGQIEKILKDNGISFEAYIRYNIKKASRIIHKIEGESGEIANKSRTSSKKSVVRRGRKSTKAKTTAIKIPAGKYGNLPGNPDVIFEVKEKGPRPKVLKAYAEEMGVEAFLDKCRLEG
ncbi:MAG: hypothetical protein KZQ91_06500 [Candidatus Thiodiazotropha sp. (ex Lucinoma borealis)]|nr:hypothetical protein [Candidatus Thiodiazotropha sp. (ex Lucinoma borealis)]